MEFAEGAKRVGQVEQYLQKTSPGHPLFLWLHLFGPHEPYELQQQNFGPRDIDRYDSEIQAADATLGQVVRLFRARDPQSVVIVTADHGEEFGDHGGRYHGTSVYDEQVRVPMVVVGPGFAAGRRVASPVQTIDLFPTVLSGLFIPAPPRIRGRDLLPALVRTDPAGHTALGPGRALAETDDYAMLAEGNLRLICARRSGACQLFDTASDAAQKADISASNEKFPALRDTLRALAASHGVYETAGLRSEGKGWPSAIVRGLSGDVEVAPELAQLLDDADAAIRRKSAELLFRLADPGQSTALRLALSREGDAETRRYLALALTRRGQGAPLVNEMLHEDSEIFRRLAALVLAERGNGAGEEILVEWWKQGAATEFDQALQLLQAFATIKSRRAVDPLVARMNDVRLRPHIARTLAMLGDEDARPALLRALNHERYVNARLPLARAILDLGGKEELAAPLIRFLGMPDPLEGGLELALEAGLTDSIGGPSPGDLSRLRQLVDSGVEINLTVPYVPSPRGARVLLLARSKHEQPGRVLIGVGTPRNSDKERVARLLPSIDASSALSVEVPVGPTPRQVSAGLPGPWAVRPGQRLTLQLFVDRETELLTVAVVPLAEELPPPPPEPWEKAAPASP